MTDSTSAGAPGPLLAALADLRAVVKAAPLRLGLPDAVLGVHVREELLATLDDHVLPRLNKPGGPVLVVVAGPTGAGKSTLVNSLVRAPVSRTGVVRPTTRAPVLVCNPADEGWYLEGRPLSGLRPVREDTARAGTVQIVSTATVPAGVAVVDAPDVDSVAADDRELATRLLAAADVWLFVLTANRYADAVPWQHLLTARDRGAVLVVVLDRVPAYASVEVHAHLSEMLVYAGLGQAPVFTISETTPQQRPAGRVRRRDPAGLAATGGRRPGDPATPSSPVPSAARCARCPAGPGRLPPSSPSHQGTARALGDDLVDAFASAHLELVEGLASGVIVTGELLRRWQDYVTAGGLDALTTPVRKGLFRRRPNSPGAADLGDALEDALAVYTACSSTGPWPGCATSGRRRPGGAEVAERVDWTPRTDLAAAAVEVIRGWAGSRRPGAVAARRRVPARRRPSSATTRYGRWLTTPRTPDGSRCCAPSWSTRLDSVLFAERDALAAEAGLTRLRRRRARRAAGRRRARAGAGMTQAPAGPAWPTPPVAPLPERLAALERALALAGDRFSAADTAPARAVLERARQRLGRSPMHTVVAIAGGTGSGKSSLFNAVVGTAAVAGRGAPAVDRASRSPASGGLSALTTRRWPACSTGWASPAVAAVLPLLAGPPARRPRAARPDPHRPA